MTEINWPGGCYCGAVRYVITDKPVFRGQCHCRACQHFASGSPRAIFLFPEDAVVWQGEPATVFQKSLDPPSVARHFCAKCGTQIANRRPGMPFWVVNPGTLDDPSHFRGPKAAIFTDEKALWHDIPEGMASFPGLP